MGLKHYNLSPNLELGLPLQPCGYDSRSADFGFRVQGKIDCYAR